MEDIKWENLERVLNEFADAVVQKARENLERNGTNATGALSQSLDDHRDERVKIEEDRYQVFIALEDYWRYIEYGTGPAHVKEGVDEFNVLHLGVQHTGEPRAQYWPPIGVLRTWANVKGLGGDESFPYAVQGKIHKEGVEPKPFLEPAIEETLPRFEDAIREAIEADVEAYVKEAIR